MIVALAMLAGALCFGIGLVAHAYLVAWKPYLGREPRGQIIHAVVDADGISVPQKHGDFVQANSIAEFLREKEGEELSIGDVIKDDEL